MTIWLVVRSVLDLKTVFFTAYLLILCWNSLLHPVEVTANTTDCNPEILLKRDFLLASSIWFCSIIS